MTTKANVQIFEKDFFIRTDGYPDCVIPTLKELVVEAKQFGKKHNFSFERAIRYIAYENTGFYALFTAFGHGFADFEYIVGPKGGIYWRAYNRKCWRQISNKHLQHK